MNSSAGSQLKSSITEASRKIESIIDDAARAADEIRADAEREAQSVLQDSSVRLASVVDPLVERIENLRVAAAALADEIDAATKNLLELSTRSMELGASPSETVSPTDTPATDGAPAALTGSAVATEEDPGPAPVAYPGKGSTPAESTSSGPPEEAVLRATQMAVAGSSRSEIEVALQDEFGLGDATPLVDDILGPA